MPKYRFTFYMALLPIFYLACNSSNNKTEKISSDSAISCEGNLPSRSSSAMDTIKITPMKLSHEGMVFIDGGEYMMGAGDNEGRPDEYPQHKVKVDGFWMDATEVTNAQFKKFTDATGYITTAEKKPDWEEMKKQLPPGSAKPGDDIFGCGIIGFYSAGAPGFIK